MQVYLWYPLSLITGGTTAKIMVAAKDNFLGKYIYKDTLARNLATVIYRVSSVLPLSSTHGPWVRKLAAPGNHDGSFFFFLEFLFLVGWGRGECGLVLPYSFLIIA